MISRISRIVSPGEPVAELIPFGWVITSPGNEVDLSNQKLSRTFIDDYENLCNLDILGV